MANTQAIAQGFISAITQESVAMQAFEDIVSWFYEMPGGAGGMANKTLASDAFAPAAYCMVHQLDTQSAAASDDLVTITSTGIRDGFIISLRISDNSRIINIKTSGNIQTLDGNDIVLNDTKIEIWLRWSLIFGKWIQITNPTETLRINKMPGGLPSTALTLSSDTGTPTRGFHTITSQTSTTDNLSFLLQTTLTADTSLLIIKATAGHTITVLHNQSGTGKIVTADGTNLTLTGNRALLLAKNGTQWDVIAKLGNWVATIGEGGTNNGSLGVNALGVYAGDGSKMTQVVGTAGQQFRVNAGGTAIEAFTNNAGQLLTAIKTADESLISNATVQDDDHLVIPVAASTTYKFTAQIYFTTPGSGDYRFTFTGPAGSTVFYTYCEMQTLNSDANIAGGTDAIINTGSASVHCIVISGQITVAGTAGDLKFRWAQSVSNVNPTVTKKGSILQAAA